MSVTAGKGLTSPHLTPGKMPRLPRAADKDEEGIAPWWSQLPDSAHHAVAAMPEKGGLSPLPREAPVDTDLLQAMRPDRDGSPDHAPFRPPLGDQSLESSPCSFISASSETEEEVSTSSGAKEEEEDAGAAGASHIGFGVESEEEEEEVLVSSEDVGDDAAGPPSPAGSYLGADSPPHPFLMLDNAVYPPSPHPARAALQPPPAALHMEELVHSAASLSRAGYNHRARKVNQDSCFAYIEYLGPHQALFCVMDGHGPHGHLVSDFVRQRLPAYLANHMQVGGAGLQQHPGGGRAARMARSLRTHNCAACHAPPPQKCVVFRSPHAIHFSPEPRWRSECRQPRCWTARQ